MKGTIITRVDIRGRTCDTRHYIRADAVEQVVMMELRRLASYLKDDEESFVRLLEQKTTADIQRERRQLEGELQKALVRNEEVARLYERVYEDNVNGKVTDEWFMQLSHKYEVERMELKTKITELRERLDNLGTMEQNKGYFLAAIRKFMEMGTLTAPLLRELIDHIDVYETQGTGKNRTQRIVIHYRFIGYIEIPEDIENYYKATPDRVWRWSISPNQPNKKSRHDTCSNQNTIYEETVIQKIRVFIT